MTFNNTGILHLFVKFGVVALLVCLGCGKLVAATSSCEDCHARAEFFVQARHLYDYYRDWLDSPHRAGGVQCQHCHGGNPGAAEKHTAHSGVRSAQDPASSLYYRRQPATCGTCHAEKTEQFVQSKHYTALMAKSNAPTCTTCHQAMSRKPYYRDIVTNACRTCHTQSNEIARADAVDRAAEILHRLSIAGAYLGWTRIYFEDNNWPDESRAKLARLTTTYDEAVTGIHGFDLSKSEQSSSDTLVELKAIFDAVSGTAATNPVD